MFTFSSVEKILALQYSMYEITLFDMGFQSVMGGWHDVPHDNFVMDASVIMNFDT